MKTYQSSYDMELIYLPNLLGMTDDSHHGINYRIGNYNVQ